VHRIRKWKIGIIIDFGTKSFIFVTLVHVSRMRGVQVHKIRWGCGKSEELPQDITGYQG
jgi:hypothetical protein